MTHYQVLGVVPTASTAEIRAAYVALARRFHPDVGGDPRRMREINAAWDTLADPGQRRAYDLSIGAPRVGTDARSDLDEPDAPDHDVDLDDVPTRPTASYHAVISVIPVLIFGASLVTVILAMILMITPLLALAGVLFILAGVGMFVVPLVTMTRPAPRRPPL
jgi:hypothetical protein